MPASKVALITGSAQRRLGWHLAQALARRGYSLVVHYNTSSTEATQAVDELTAAGAAAIAIQADLANEAAVKSMVRQTLDRFGRVDVLANCAAIWQSKPLEEATAADVRANFDANTLGTFLCCQQAGLAMVRQPTGGVIINFGDWAIERPYLNYSAYFASKGSIPTLTRTFAVELGTRNPNVRVNCILPGPVMLPPDLPLAERQAAIRGTLVKREGTPENVVQAALHFIDNDFVTGACLPVDGGRSIYAAGSEL
jgi:pteridine reductase